MCVGESCLPAEQQLACFFVFMLSVAAELQKLLLYQQSCADQTRPYLTKNRDGDGIHSSLHRPPEPVLIYHGACWANFSTRLFEDKAKAQYYFRHPHLEPSTQTNFPGAMGNTKVLFCSFVASPHLAELTG